MSGASYYLGPSAGRWVPAGWGDVVTAAAGGLLDESSWVELKGDLPAASRPSNLETARDLASLSLDGGLYLVGVAADGDKAGKVVGAADAAGLADRITQLASARITPPLAVRPQVLPHPTDPARGCVAVAVPASLDAPHMVDERYWGRSPKGKRVLSDGEVRRLLELRSARRQSFDDALRELAITFDQVPDGVAGHVFLLARPTTPGAALPANHFQGSHWAQFVSRATDMRYAQWDGFAGVYNRLPHPDGPAGTSAPAHVDAPTEEFVHAVLLNDSSSVGQIQAFSGAGTVLPAAGDPPEVAPMVMVQLVQQMLLLVDRVGREVLRSDTGWQVGVHITGLSGATSSIPYFSGAHRYPHATYTRSLTASAAQVATDSTALVKQLVAPLLRGLGAEEILSSYSGPESIRQLR